MKSTEKMQIDEKKSIEKWKRSSNAESKWQRSLNDKGRQTTKERKWQQLCRWPTLFARQSKSIDSRRHIKRQSVWHLKASWNRYDYRIAKLVDCMTATKPTRVTTCKWSEFELKYWHGVRRQTLPFQFVRIACFWPFVAILIRFIVVPNVATAVYVWTRDRFGCLNCTNTMTRNEFFIQNDNFRRTCFFFLLSCRMASLNRQEICVDGKVVVAIIAWKLKRCVWTLNYRLWIACLIELTLTMRRMNRCF